MWMTLKYNFGVTSTTKLRILTTKFDNYKLPQTTMRQHLSEMGNLICDLNNAGHVLSDKQQVQAVIRSFTIHGSIWRSHNDNIWTFVDIACHVEVEDERLQTTNPEDEALIAEHDARHYKPMHRRSMKFQKKGSKFHYSKRILLRRI